MTRANFKVPSDKGQGTLSRLPTRRRLIPIARHAGSALAFFRL